jgi:hypothetical protein
MIARLAALVAIVAGTAPVQAEPFHHPYGEWREYNRDWLAACPDVIDEDATDYYGFSCFASTGSQQLNSANLPAYKLTVIRSRLTGDLDLSIVLADDAQEPDLTKALTLSFSGEPPVTLAFGADLETRYNTINQFYPVDDTLEAELFDKMRARNSVLMTVPLADGSTKDVRFSLQGVLASIDFMATYARRVAQY